MASRQSQEQASTIASATEDSGSPAARRASSRLVAILRPLLGLLLFGFVVFAVVRSWPDVRATAERVGSVDLALALVLALAGLGASVLTWRVAAAELGASFRFGAASKVYLVGQLGKYLPGSVWALALQMELAARAGMPRSRAMVAAVVAIAVNVVTGLALGMVVVPGLVEETAVQTAAIVVALGGGALLLAPPVLTRLVKVGLRTLRRPSADVDLSWRSIATASGWSVSSWGCYGLSLYVLTVAVGAPAGESFLLCLGAMALAMTLGFLVVVAPSGIGVREGVTVATLAPVLPAAEALAVALLARVVFTVADLLAAGLAAPIRLRSKGGLDTGAAPP